MKVYFMTDPKPKAAVQEKPDGTDAFSYGCLRNEDKER